MKLRFQWLLFRELIEIIATNQVLCLSFFLPSFILLHHLRNGIIDMINPLLGNPRLVEFEKVILFLSTKSHFVLVFDHTICDFARMNHCFEICLPRGKISKVPIFVKLQKSIYREYQFCFLFHHLNL